MKAPGSRHAVLRFRHNAVWSSIGLDTLPKVASVCFPGLKLQENRRDSYFALPNGSEIWLGGLDDKERVEKILGQEYSTIFFNEVSQVPYASVMIALTRLAQKTGLINRAWYDCNPPGTAHWTHDAFVKKRDPETRKPWDDPSSYREMQVNPGDNAKNIDPAYLASLAAMPERQRRRFLEGEWQPDVPGALWSLETIDRNRVQAHPELTRIVVAVDPSGARNTEDKRSDDIGIIVAGVGTDGEFYVLEDLTCNMSPEQWARRVVGAFYRWNASTIVAEVNFGGGMVESTIRNVDRSVPIKVEHARSGKHVRAEPVSALYEQNRVHHVGRFVDLEEQMLNMTTSGYVGSKSPDRADALVWALTEVALPRFVPRISIL
jgi:hypothetical protein